MLSCSQFADGLSAADADLRLSTHTRVCALYAVHTAHFSLEQRGSLFQLPDPPDPLTLSCSECRSAQPIQVLLPKVFGLMWLPSRVRRAMS